MLAMPQRAGPPILGASGPDRGGPAPAARGEVLAGTHTVLSRFGSARQAAWGWLRSVAPQRRYLGRDLLAGLPGAIGSVPDGMAAAILAASLDKRKAC